MDATEDYLPLWLELHVDERAWLFELRAGEERAVVVGSHPGSDVCIRRDGVASTHFHFEREGDALVVVPGYRASLIVDHVPAPEPLVLAKTARLEFCGTLLEASIHDVPPLHMLLEARDGTDRMMRRPDYFERLPEDTDPTVLGLAAVAPAEAEEPEDAFDFLTTGTWRAPTPSEAVGPQGTLIMRRPRSSDPSPPTAEQIKPPSLPPIAPTERLRLEPWTATAYSLESSPTKVEVPRPHGYTPGRTAELAPGSVATPVETTGTSSLAPLERAVPAPKQTASAIAQLGLAASRHPLRVAAAALPVYAVLALALVGAARLTGKAHVANAAQPAVILSSGAPSVAVPKLTTTAPPLIAPPAPVALASAPLSAPSSTSSAPASTPTPSIAPKPRSVRPSKHVFLGR